MSTPLLPVENEAAIAERRADSSDSSPQIGKSVAVPRQIPRTDAPPARAAGDTRSAKGSERAEPHR